LDSIKKPELLNRVKHKTTLSDKQRQMAQIQETLKTGEEAQRE